jgi:hypothetical protein
MLTVKELVLSPDGIMFEPLPDEDVDDADADEDGADDDEDDGDDEQPAAIRATTATRPTQPSRERGLNVP